MPLLWWRHAIASVTLGVWSTLSPWVAPAIAQPGPFFDSSLAVQSLPEAALYTVLVRSCPDARVQATELDAVRVIEGKLAVAAAMRAAAQSNAEVRYGTADGEGQYRFANTPREVATAFRQTLGASSLLTRSVDALAFLTDTVEETAQIPLDRFNEVADLLVEQAHRAGLGSFPVIRFRSRIENDRAGVTVSARW